MHYLPDSERFKRMTTSEMRSHFLVQDLFAEGEVRLEMADLDRVVVGGAVPTTGAPLALEASPEMDAGFFTERREVGILNIGGAGRITVGGDPYDMAPLDMLYVGRGTKDVSLESVDESDPAHFYLVSYPAHTNHPTTHVSQEEANLEEIGSAEKASRRDLYQYIRPGVAESAQLVMGITTLAEGSVWNTMPAHTHERRTEVYLYFDVGTEDAVFHLMGEPEETRSLVIRNEEAVLSPGWSIHAGAGTSSYTFCWAMGGENQDFDDMQGVNIPSMM